MICKRRWYTPLAILFVLCFLCVPGFAVTEDSVTLMDTLIRYPVRMGGISS